MYLQSEIAECKQDVQQGLTCFQFALYGFVFLIFFYPYFENTLLWFINYFCLFINVHLPPHVNLILMGWKDGAIFFLVLLLLAMDKKISLFILSSSLMMLIYFLFGLDGLKKIGESFFVSLLLVVYFKGIVNALLHVELRKVVTFFVGLILVYLCIGYMDLLVRNLFNITSDNFYNHAYLVANNQFRCDKAFLSGLVSQADYINCLTVPLNFYKLDFVSGQYIALRALFLPVGDSVVFSILLFSVLQIFFLYYTCFKKKLTWMSMFFLLVIIGSIFLTYNRFISIMVLVEAVLMLACIFLYLPQDKIKGGLLFILVASLFLFNSHYLFFSIFAKEVPSNIGHYQTVDKLINSSHELSAAEVKQVKAAEVKQVKAAEVKRVKVDEIERSYPFLKSLSFSMARYYTAWQVQLNRVLIKYGSMLLLLLVFTFGAVLMLQSRQMMRWFLLIQLSWFTFFYLIFQVMHLSLLPGLASTLSGESNFLVVGLKYQYAGLAMYAFIFSVITLLFIQNTILMFKNGYAWCAMLLMLYLGAFFLYQFISPYIISGYVVFSLILMVLISCGVVVSSLRGCND